MTLARAFQVGALRCHTLEGGRFWLDGGAMFGVVPRMLWERQVPPDGRHRIPLATRSLLIEHPDGPVLIDTALGGKESAKFQDIYGIENRGARGGTQGPGTQRGGTQLDDALAEAGFTAADVRWVINTHLHFDHAGGNTTLNGVAADSGTVRPAFPHATYVVQRGDLEFARRVNERTRASYLSANFEPIAEAGRFRLLEGDSEVLPGIAVRLTPGHVPYHQSIVVTSGGDTAVFLGDVVPTTTHLPLAWIMGYDVEPLRTLESKRALLSEAAAGGWLLVFSHDPRIAAGRAVAEGRAYGLEETVAAD